jgi:hypothetical protein
VSGSFLTKWERVIKSTPRDGYVIEPERPWEHQVASVICGHDIIQRLDPYDQESFELFVREVLRSNPQ